MEGKGERELLHVLMRDEKEGRKKQARSNKQQGKATQHTQTCTWLCERCVPVVHLTILSTSADLGPR